MQLSRLILISFCIGAVSCSRAPETSDVKSHVAPEATNPVAPGNSTPAAVPGDIARLQEADATKTAGVAGTAGRDSQAAQRSGPETLTELWMKEYLKAHPELQPVSIIPGGEGEGVVTFALRADRTKQKSFKLVYVQDGGVWKVLKADEVAPED